MRLICVRWSGKERAPDIPSIDVRPLEGLDNSAVGMSWGSPEGDALYVGTITSLESLPSLVDMHVSLLKASMNVHQYTMDTRKEKKGQWITGKIPQTYGFYQNLIR